MVQRRWVIRIIRQLVRQEDQPIHLTCYLSVQSERERRDANGPDSYNFREVVRESLIRIQIAFFINNLNQGCDSIVAQFIHQFGEFFYLQGV